MKLRNTKRCVVRKRHHGTCSRKVRVAFSHLVLAFLLALSHAGKPRAISAQTAPSNEYAVKAAFLYHFAQFVDWPDGTFPQADSPLVYCTIGEDPFHGALEASLLGKKMDGHPFQVGHARQIGDDLQACNVLFIGEKEKGILPEVLANLKGRPVLLVGESDRFVQDGGMIGFCLEANKIRFEVNMESAEKAKLKISAKLLALAKNVIGGPRKG